LVGANIQRMSFYRRHCVFSENQIILTG
jgi:hypothetical protein